MKMLKMHFKTQLLKLRYQVITRRLKFNLSKKKKYKQKYAWIITK